MIKSLLNNRWTGPAVAIAIILLSASIFLLSLSVFQQSVHASEPESGVIAPWDADLRGAVGLGIVNNTGYFVVWGRPNVLYKVDLNKARDWYED